MYIKTNKHFFFQFLYIQALLVYIKREGLQIFRFEFFSHKYYMNNLPIEPKLVEYNRLKKLLRHSYNEGSSPFTQIVSKYSSIIKDNWFNIIVILFVIIMILLFFTKNKSIDEIDSDPNDQNTMFSEIEFEEKNIKKQKKYNNINEYYTQNFRLYKK
jgi:hypothetical protein